MLIKDLKINLRTATCKIVPMDKVVPKHLVLIRHGQSDGDLRRAMPAQPSSYELKKHPHDEEQTDLGRLQSYAAGQYILKYVLGKYGIQAFDLMLTSPLIRTRQSADSTELEGEWVTDNRLTERNRGLIQGMTKKQHAEEYPGSFRDMTRHPFHWTPEGGESILRVSHRFAESIDEFKKSKMDSVVMMVHRDIMWASHATLDHTPFEKLDKMDTNFIGNGHIFHLTNVNPQSGEPEGEDLVWKRSVCPWALEEEIIRDSKKWAKLEA